VLEQFGYDEAKFNEQFAIAIDQRGR